MKKSSRKMCITAIAAAACCIAPLALAACGEKTNNNNGDDETVTVTFDAGRGEIFGDRFYKVDVEKGGKVSEPSEKPVQEDYIFTGWNATGSSNDPLFDFNTAINNDLTLQAVWARAYTVTFDAGRGEFAGGEKTLAIKVAEGGKVSAPQVTPPENRELDGWTDGYYTWDFDTSVVTRDVTLTAEYDFSAAIKTALAPFTYRELSGGISITGVKDKTVTALTVPSVVTSIGDRAFQGCAALETLVIDDSVKTIGEGAISECAALKNVTLPSGLKTLDDFTFYGCTSLEEIDIPDTLTALGVSAFSGCSSLKSIELPVGVKDVSGSAFDGCTSLEEVKLGANVNRIGPKAFRNCASLAAFEIPSGVEELTDYAFAGCISLESIVVPATCKTVGWGVFSECTGLTSANINAETLESSAFDGCSALRSLTFGANVKEIEQHAFAECTSLTDLVIPDTVLTLGSTAFEGCSSLRSVDIGDGVSVLEYGVFKECYALREVSVGSGVTRIKEDAFGKCYSLLSFTVPSGVTSVHNSAFYNCVRLVEIYNYSQVSFEGSSSPRPTSLRALHTSATEESIIKKVGDFSFITDGSDDLLIDYSGNAESIVLPADYEGSSYMIYHYALACNPNLKSVKYSAGVKGDMGHLLFGSDNVTSLTVDSGNSVYKEQSNCIIVDNRLVLGCKTSVIPTDGGVTEIGADVFCGNKSIVDLDIPSNITSVDRDAFNGMDGLIRTVGHLNYVDNWVVGFAYDGSADIDLEFEQGTVGIAENTFNADSNYLCRKITSVKCNAELKHIGASAFSGCEPITSVELNDGLLTIGASAFYRCNKLTEMIIPDSVDKIGNSAFSTCLRLKYVRLPEGLTEIGKNVFYEVRYNNSGLESIYIPSSVTKIGDGSFSTCGTPTVYFGGDAAAWSAITKGTNNTAINNASRIKYYSATEEAGKWHFGDDGKPTLW